MRFGRFFCIVLSISMLFIFSSCASENSGVLGVYSCARLEMDGEDFHVLDVYPDGCSLQLAEWGQAWLNIEDESFYGRWELDGESFTLDVNGELSYGTLSDGVCTISFSQNAMTHYFLGEGATLPQKTASVQNIPLTEQQIFWNGDWYGWWTIFEADGEWADHNGQRFDCFARFDIEHDGKGTMLFWDEMQSSSEPIACIDLILNGDGYALSAADGYFLDGAIANDLWTADPQLFPVDSTFYVENIKYEGKSGSFKYNIILRPWGRTWEDLEAIAPDMLPYFYDRWYLPLLMEGGNMPDGFIYESETVIGNTLQNNKEQ